MPLVQAKRLLRDADAVFLPVDHKYYSEVSGRVMRLLRSYADRFEQVSVDEAYLDVTDRVKGRFEQAERLAAEIKRVLRLREGLTCSVGVAPNKLVAKIASGYRKPDGLTVVRPNEVRPFLAPLPVSEIPGVGGKTAERLRAMGVERIGELAEVGLDTLVDRFGRTIGTFLHLSAQGVDDSAVKEREEREQLSHIVTLREDSRDLQVLGKVVEEVAKELWVRVQEAGVGFRTISILAVMEGLKLRSRSRSFDNPVGDYDTLVRTGRELLARLLDEEEGAVRRLGLRVAGLTTTRGQRTLTDYLQKPSEGR
jgi:DNA polymerase IV (DinB-like DNA polymerase)